MSKVAQEILDSALKLSDEEREEVLIGLLDSMHDNEISQEETEFHEELRRRIAEVEDGTAKTIPRNEARQMILEKKDVIPH